MRIVQLHARMHMEDSGSSSTGGGEGRGYADESEDTEALRSVWNFKAESVSRLCDDEGKGRAAEGHGGGATRGGRWGVDVGKEGEGEMGRVRGLDKVQFAWFETGQVWPTRSACMHTHARTQCRALIRACPFGK